MTPTNTLTDSAPIDDFDGLLIASRIKVQNASVTSSPLTWGFPAPSAFVGLTHALERKLKVDHPLRLLGVGIVCHSFDPQLHSTPGRPYRLSLRAHPINRHRKPLTFGQKGCAHLTVSLAISVQGVFDCAEGPEDLAVIAQRARSLLLGMRVAGGSIIDIGDVALREVPNTDAEQDSFTQQIKRKLLPGFALVHRPDHMQKRLEELRVSNPNATAFDVVVDVASITSVATKSVDGDVAWEVQRKTGWLVPLPIGYQAISELYQPGAVECSRDPNSPLRFVEQAYSIGEWVSPHRISSITDIFWRHHSNVDAGTYHCVNHYAQGKVS